MKASASTDPATTGRFSGALRNAALWAVGFAAVGVVIALIAASGGTGDPLSRAGLVASLVARFALFGAICGTVFWWLTGLLFERAEFARFGRLPVALCGAVGTAIFVPLFMQTMNLLSGDGLVAWSLVFDDAIWAFLFGGAAAVASLEMARRWQTEARGRDR